MRTLPAMCVVAVVAVAAASAAARGTERRQQGTGTPTTSNPTATPTAAPTAAPTASPTVDCHAISNSNHAECQNTIDGSSVTTATTELDTDTDGSRATGDNNDDEDSGSKMPVWPIPAIVVGVLVLLGAGFILKRKRTGKTTGAVTDASAPDNLGRATPGVTNPL